MLLVLPLITLIFLYGSRFIPYPASAEAGGYAITVLTYNLSAVNPDGDKLADFLQNTNADIVAMQEIHQETANRLETRLATQYPYQVRYDDTRNPSEFEGRMLLSRYPIPSHQAVAADYRTVLYLRAEIEVEGQTVSVFNIHLPPPRLQHGFSTAMRDGDFAVLLSNLQTEALNQPYIIMGDFNISDMTGIYGAMVNDMTLIDSQRAAGYGFGTSFPNLGWIPSMVRLDYVFVTDSLSPLEVHVIHDGTSDHFPVWARLQLKDTSNE
jgi:endonuclease/exonuclease/phosphatase family metal-dependent hydrolase